jgi:hypothetical protein
VFLRARGGVVSEGFPPQQDAVGRAADGEHVVFLSTSSAVIG